MAPLPCACAAALRRGKAWLDCCILKCLLLARRRDAVFSAPMLPVASLRSLQVQGAQATVEKLLRDSKIGPLDKLRLIVVFIGACPVATPHDTLQRRATWCNTARHAATRLGGSDDPTVHSTSCGRSSDRVPVDFGR